MSQAQSGSGTHYHEFAWRGVGCLFSGAPAGSIILAHALSALEAADLWPSCQYFLLQAANMLWIKPGMELQVFRLICSVSEYVFREQTNKFLDKGLRHPFTKAMLAATTQGF